MGNYLPTAHQLSIFVAVENFLPLMRAQGMSKQRITRLCLAQQGRPQVGSTAIGRPISPDYGNNLLNLSPLQKGSGLSNLNLRI
jgi:hypothetical protein